MNSPPMPPMTNRPGHRSRCLIPAVLLLLGVVGCGGPRFVTEDADAAYRAAMRDAKVAEPSEVSTRLTPITPSNEALVWRGTPGRSRLLVVTWGGPDDLDAAAGDPLALAEGVWVTVVPEVQEACRRLGSSEAPLVLRLRQLLGLPPDAPYDRFTELWVHPNDLFRPCPDPEITDRECEPDFPRSERFVRISDAHRQWFRTTHDTMYGPDGYPWTRLGYTYDWGDPETDFGFSEFVIRAGATVLVRAVVPTAVYCK